MSPSHDGRSLINVPKKSLGGIRKIVVLGQPAALNALKTIDSFDGPMAAGFPCLSGMKHSELTIGQSVQGTSLIVLVSLQYAIEERFRNWAPRELTTSFG